MTTILSNLQFFVNGHKVVENEVDPEWTLAYYLRNKLKLCGTKLGCGEGGCGSCTVMLSKLDFKTKNIINIAINACLTPLCSAQDCAITTIEGIGNIAKGIHPVQERIAKSHGSQCGFCTPGMVMSMYTLLRNKPHPTMQDVQVSLGGNLCRCTGYRPILEGFSLFTQKEGCCRENGTPNGCCKNQTENQSIPIENGEKDNLYENKQFKPYDSTQDPIFPPELQVSHFLNSENLTFYGDRVTWHRVVTLEHLLTLKATFPFAKILGGFTKLGTDTRHKESRSSILIHPVNIPELKEITLEECGVRCGASVTLTELQIFLQKELTSMPSQRIQIFEALMDILYSFGGTQVRNVATVGGSIASGSPTSDLNPILMAAHSILTLKSKDGERVFIFDETFYKGNAKNILRSDEILLSILIPFTKRNEYFGAFKQARRKIQDGAIVNAGMFVEFDIGTNIIKVLRLAFGGVSSTIIMARTTAVCLTGRPWNEDTVTEACNSLKEDLPFNLATPGITSHYKSSLALSFFFKFYLRVTYVLNQQLSYVKQPPSNFRSGAELYFPHLHKSHHQMSQIAYKEKAVYDSIGTPIEHLSALNQSTGEALYTDDMGNFENECTLAFVCSTRPNAQILSIDASEALEMDGVLDFVSAKDLPSERNKMGPVIDDEEIFASERVTCHGQIIGAIVAVDKATAQRAAKNVKVEYKDILPVILTIQDAIRHNSFYHDWTRILKSGDVEKGFSEAEHVLDGEISIGGQAHFYLETQCSIVIPKSEDDEIEVISSTQHPANLQLQIAKVLDIPWNRIVVRVKRMGGGFGGKITKSALIALPLAVAAKKVGRPVRCVLDRDEDMMICGTRHPFTCKYKVGFNTNGKVVALKVAYYSNAGNTLDVSHGVVEKAILAATNAYKIQNVDFTGYSCKTNVASNTAFRGLGTPQSMLFCEIIFDRVADFLTMDACKLRELNMFKEGDVTAYNQLLENCSVGRCWEECISKSKLEARRNEVDVFNRENRWRKRGIYVVPTTVGVAFTAQFLNQAGALVMVYRDGSVLLTHSGVEMGQGLHTKMTQVASRVLQIPLDKIHICETSTDKVPNTTQTAASFSSDLNGMAVLDACKIIKERLEPYKIKNPTGKWEDWVAAAFFDRVNLSTTGFYKVPEIGYDMNTNKGQPFLYYCYGAACSEVEIDCLTGDHNVIRTDIVMDVGESLNPAIDVGQIEGAFIQGYGLYILEELCRSSQGELLTKGPANYKIPTVADIPGQMNVALLRGSSNPKAVFSSKAMGEPPLFLAASVFFAIREAIKAARRDSGVTEYLNLNSPLTAQKIRMACEDQFTKKL